MEVTTLVVVHKEVGIVFVHTAKTDKECWAEWMKHPDYQAEDYTSKDDEYEIDMRTFRL